MSHRFIPARLSFLYGSLFLLVGIFSPFWPLWLASRGLTSAQIATITAAALLIKTIASPAISQHADKSGRLTTYLPILSVLTLISFIIYSFQDTYLSLFICALLTFLFLTPQLPLAESLTAHYTRTYQLNYARMRVWGSIAFMSMSFGAGAYIDVFQIDALPLLIFCAAAIGIVSTLLLPKTHFPPAVPGAKSPILSLIQDPAFLIVLLAGTFIQSSHSTYYVFSTLHWIKSGISEWIIGLLWAWAVFAEIVLFWFANSITQHFRARFLLCAAGFIGALRWAGTAMDPSLYMLFGLQTLHAVSFGLTHLSVQAYITRNLPQSHTSSAQALYSSLAMGVGSAATMYISGLLYPDWAGETFYFAAGVASLGALMLIPLQRRDIRISSK